MTGANGHDDGRPPVPPAPPGEPLPGEVVREIRRGVERLVNGANELTVIALLSPVFLLGVYLATTALSPAHAPRARAQRPLDHALFAAYALALVALALRARLGARHARRLLPAATSDDPASRADARRKMLRLAGPAPLRRAADRIASRGCLLLVVFAVLALVAWILVPTPDPVWTVVFLGTVVGMDVRWRALVADVADQMPE